MFIEQIFHTARPTYEDLKEFLNRFREDSRVEFKRSISEDIDKNLLRVVVAFSNSEGGILIIGVTDKNREIVGCELDPETLENYLLTRIEPSISGLFVIETVQIPDGKHVLIVEVERSPQLHAIKIEGNAKKGVTTRYEYFYRSAMSSRLMPPSVLNRVSVIKSDLTYNFNFRIRIFLDINELLSSLLSRINFRGKNKIDEAKLEKLSRDYLKFYREPNAIDLEIVKVIRAMRLEFLYQEIWERITLFYGNILEAERYIPHKELTFEEDMSLLMLKRILNHGLNIDEERANVEYLSALRYIGLDHEVFYDKQLDVFSAKALFAFMLDYLTPQGYENEEARRKLRKFDIFLINRKNFNYKPFPPEDEYLTVDDLEKLMKEFLEIEPNHTDLGVFEKADLRRGQFLYYFTLSLTKMVLKLIELRNHLYFNLSIPIKRNASKGEYEEYLKNSAVSFIYPAHEEL